MPKSPQKPTIGGLLLLIIVEAVFVLGVLGLLSFLLDHYKFELFG